MMEAQTTTTTIREGPSIPSQDTCIQMTMWQHSAPSNPTILIPQHPPDTDSPSNPPELQEEETLEFQEEYPREEAEEAEEEEDSPLPCRRHEQPQTQGTSLSATLHSHSQEIASNLKRS